jgi:type IV pilus assembly protein PilB
MRKRIGDLMVDAGVISEAQLKEALKFQKETKSRIGDLLISQGFITEQQLIEVLEFQLGIPHIQLYKYKIDATITQIITENMAKRYMAIPLRKEGNKLIVAMSDPLDYIAIDDLRMSTGFQIDPVIATKDELQRAIQRYYGMSESVERLMQQGQNLDDPDAEEEQLRTEDAPIIRMVNQMIEQAVQLGASDIHVDPQSDDIRIRFRVDGVLRTERTLPKSTLGIIISRLKIMAQLNIAERRLPQDGRLQLEHGYHIIDLRISILPTVYGEKVVIRILDTSQAVNQLTRLGFTSENEQAFRRMIQHNNGLVLITGPTGSGKTSTLYSALNEIDKEQMNIITLEDPVEYQIDGVNQVQVLPQAGLTFAKGLRSILRQDPDVLMVGEIRDTETADMAVRAALTGHLVFSTLHTNDSIGAITRLIHMEVEPFLVSSATVGVVAQRLIRRVCPDCAEEYLPSDAEQELLLKRGIRAQRWLKGIGCGRCNLTGYRGRLAIQEVLRIDENIRNFIVERRPEPIIRQYAIENGMITLLDDGLQKAAQGLTTVTEVLRVAVES